MHRHPRQHSRETPELFKGTRSLCAEWATIQQGKQNCLDRNRISSSIYLLSMARVSCQEFVALFSGTPSEVDSTWFLRDYESHKCVALRSKKMLNHTNTCNLRPSYWLEKSGNTQPQKKHGQKMMHPTNAQLRALQATNASTHFTVAGNDQ